MSSVSVLSKQDAWAVGLANARALIVHWDGRRWAQADLKGSFYCGGATGNLQSVYARTAKDVWAVGSCAYGRRSRGLIVHWDGSSWTVITSPKLSAPYTLNGVTAPNAADVWAVGSSGSDQLVLHWDGTIWAQVRIPLSTATDSQLYAITATSKSDIWAVGTFGNSGEALHFDGRTWVATPLPRKVTALPVGVAAASRRNACIVGTYQPKGTPLIYSPRWNGTSWRVH